MAITPTTVTAIVASTRRPRVTSSCASAAASTMAATA
jgi:hypothetical protein